MPRFPVYLLLLLAPALSALAQAPPAARVQLAEAQAGPVFEELVLQGSVVGAQVAMLSASVSGLIVQAPPRPGTRIEQGEAIVQLDSALAELAVDRALAARQQAEEALADARRRRREGAQLVERGDIARSEQDTRVSAVRQTEALLAERDAQHRLAEEQLHRHRVQAPFSGIIAQRMTAPGEWINPGEPLVGLVNDQALWLEFALPQRYFGQVPTDATVRVTLAGRQDQSIDGRVAGIIPLSGGAARQFNLRVELADWPRVAPGSSAQGRLRLDLQARAVLVPRDAINRYPDGRTTVWLAEQRDGQLVSREQRVELRGEFGDTVAIKAGLENGARVVVRGNEGLTAGRTLSVVQGNAL